MDEAVLVALLALGSGPWIGLLLGGAVTVGHLLMGSRPAKVVFNGSQVALSAAAAAVVFGAVGAGSPVLSAMWLFALVLGLTTYAAIGVAAMTVLFTLLEGRSIRSLVGESWVLVVGSTAGNLLFGIVLAFLVVTDDRMIVLGIGLMVAVQLGYRGYVRIVDDRARTQLLQDTTRALVEVAGDPDRLGDVLVRLTKLFGGRRAELVLTTPHGPTFLAATPAGVEEAVSEPADVSTTEAFDRGRDILRQAGDDGTSSAMAVPVVYEGKVMGALAILERHGLEPWSEIDLGLLGSLAHEVAVALRTIDLFEEVRHERGRYADESRKLTDVVNATSDGIVTLDGSGNVTVWNEAMAAITGTAAAEALGRAWFTVLRLRDQRGRDLGDQHRNVITDSLTAPAGESGVDLQVLRRDGQWRWLRCTINPVVSASEGNTGLVIVARDVTAQVEIEEMKADFLATVSHELRTPLTPLMGFLETLDRHGDELSPAHRQRALDAMRKQLGRLGHLVDDLLTTTELDRGTTTIERRPVVVGDVLTTVVDGLSESDAARVALTVSGDDLVVTDASALARITGELLVNGLKHTDGAITVRVHTDGDEVLVAVGDEGPGIAPSDHARIFERFGRLGDHLHRTQGPGLGLAIARALAEELDGRLDLDSDLGCGSTFTLALPRTQPSGARGHDVELLELAEQ